MQTCLHHTNTVSDVETSISKDYVPRLQMLEDTTRLSNLRVPCTLSHLSLAALALHSLTWLLRSRFRLGSQSGLFSSIRQAGFPERKCLEHILSLEIVFSVGSDHLMADKNPARRL